MKYFDFILFFCFFKLMKSRFLTAIVMPFHTSQIESLLFNLNTWKFFIPSKLNNIKPSLVFLSSGYINSEYKAIITSFFKAHGRLFFSNMIFYNADLTIEENKYLRGTQLMFETMLELKCFKNTQNISHIFYMEPDSLPIKHFWLDQLMLEVKTKNEDLIWMKGSKYRGNPMLLKERSKAFALHINGNSIYNIGSSKFREFYFNFVKPELKVVGKYDLKIFEVLLKNNSALLRKHGKHFFYTNFIQNIGGLYRPCSFLPSENDTFIIHITNRWEEYINFFNSIVPFDKKINTEAIFKKLKIQTK